MSILAVYGDVWSKLLRIEGEEEVHVRRIFDEISDYINLTPSAIYRKDSIAPYADQIQKSSLRTIGRISSSTCLSLMNFALAFLGSVLYWKYWQR